MREVDVLRVHLKEWDRILFGSNTIHRRIRWNDTNFVLLELPLLFIDCEYWKIKFAECGDKYAFVVAWHAVQAQWFQLKRSRTSNARLYWNTATVEVSKSMDFVVIADNPDREWIFFPDRAVISVQGWTFFSRYKSSVWISMTIYIVSVIVSLCRGFWHAALTCWNTYFLCP